MPSSTVENYIKQIYLEAQKTGRDLVPMGRLAELMNVAPGTTTTMIKALADSGLVAYEPRTGTRLTRGGEKLALHVLRRHRLIEVFLVKMLGFDWTEVHVEAEELEHAISDKLLSRIDAALGHPTVDPHGDPIPDARGVVVHDARESLGTCGVGEVVRVARVLDQSAGFLQFLKRSGLTPGTKVTVESRDADADAVVVRKGRETLTLGSVAASRILVAGSRP